MRCIFRHRVGLLFVVLIAGGARSAVAQEIKLKLSHFAPTAHNHHANVSVPWTEEVKKRV
jgi:TRAP-type C4-dicarboxylate transport system substrate-binding protein